MRYLLVGLLLAASASLPSAGQDFPDLHARDVNGIARETRSFHGKPTLVVAITDRDAGDGEQGWWDAADRITPGVQKLSLISLSLPFFVSDSYARNKAKERIPKAYWSVNLLDTDGKMAKELRLPDDKLPTVFALDPQGRVEAAFHGKVTDPGAEAIWRALPGARPQG